VFYIYMKVRDKTTFKSGGLYNITAQIQENTLLNRGLLDVGGVAVPQMIMSNNKDESIERGVMEGFYLFSSFLAPFVMLPFFNKTALSHNGLVKNFANNERKIIEVSKEYLTKDADYLLAGIRKTAEKIEKEASKKGKKVECKQDFENIINRFKGNEGDLKEKLLNAHEKIFFTDFICTTLMWVATPWAAMEVTKKRTNRSGFSATYGMMDEKESKLNAAKHEKEKRKKLAISALIAIIPSVIVPKLVTAGLKGKNSTINFIKRAPQNFNYTKGIFPSKFIFGAMWALCDYPSSLVSARDKYERKDRSIRNAALLVVFFAGDFIMNNVLGRLADNVFNTQIMDRSKITNKTGFIKKMFMQPKNFDKIDDISNVALKTVKNTKKIGAALYWLTLFANMALIGFGLPTVLNKILKKTVEKDKSTQKSL